MQECEPLVVLQRKDERGVFKVACAHVSFLAAGSPLRFPVGLFVVCCRWCQTLHQMLHLCGYAYIGGRKEKSLDQ